MARKKKDVGTRLREYRKKVGVRDVDQASQTAWWLMPKEAGANRLMANVLWNQIERIQTGQGWKSHTEMNAHKVYYGRKPVTNMSAFGIVAPDTMDETFDDLERAESPKLGIIESMGNTLKSRIAADRTKVTVQTDGGTAEERRRAELLDQFLLGAMENGGVYDLGPEVFVDSLIFGTGYLQVCKEHTRKGGHPTLKAKRVPPMNFLVDEREAVELGRAMQFYVKRAEPRPGLAIQYPHLADEIRDAPKEPGPLERDTPWIDDLPVMEAWRLPSCPGSGDGRHVVSCRDVILLDEPYERDEPPIAIFRWDTMSVSWYGRSLVHQLMSVQEGLRRSMDSIDMALQTCAMPMWLVEQDSEVEVDHIVNSDIGMILRYRGTRPEVQAGNPVSEQMFRYVQDLWGKAYDLSGISQVSAAGEVPGGIKSGEGMRVHQAIETLRFKDTVLRYQKFHIDVARIMIDVARECYLEDPKFSVRASTADRFLKRIPWRKVDLEDDRFVIRLFPTSMLPATPEGKLSTVQDLIQMGIVTPEDAPSLLDFPDVKNFYALQTAQEKFIERVISAIVDEGKFIAPSPFLNLPLAIKKVSQAYLENSNDNLAPEKLALLAKWVERAKELLQAAQPPPPPNAGPAGPAPGAPPSPLKPGGA